MGIEVCQLLTAFGVTVLCIKGDSEHRIWKGWKLAQVQWLVVTAVNMQSKSNADLKKLDGNQANTKLIVTFPSHQIQWFYYNDSVQ